MLRYLRCLEEWERPVSKALRKCDVDLFRLCDVLELVYELQFRLKQPDVARRLQVDAAENAKVLQPLHRCSERQHFERPLQNLNVQRVSRVFLIFVAHLLFNELEQIQAEIWPPLHPAVARYLL